MTINPTHSNMIDVDDGWTDYIEIEPSRREPAVLHIHAANPGAYLSMEAFRELGRFLEQHQCVQCGGLLDHGCICPEPSAYDQDEDMLPGRIGR